MSKAMTAASKEQLVELMQYLSQNISVPTIGIGGGFAPIGTIISYMGTTAPQDYLICDGSTYNIADYKQLSDFFAAQFGSANFFGGDGVTTFKVPDLRGEFLRGSGTNGHSGEGDGRPVGLHQAATIHIEIDTEKNTGRGYAPYSVSDNLIVKNCDKNFRQSSSQDGTTFFTATKTPGELYAGFFTSRPTNTSVLYCIKAVAAGDVYSTEERVVGTWIDGKPIYQKTLTTEISYTGAGDVQTERIIFDGTGIGDIIDFKSISKRITPTGAMWGINYGAYSDTTVYMQQTTARVRKLNGVFDIQYQMTFPNNTTVNMITTIYYTKTTD